MSSLPVSPLSSPSIIDEGRVPALTLPIARALGFRYVYPWQRTGLGLVFSPARLVVVSAPRRSGKTVIDEISITTRCLTAPDSQCFYTEQTREKAAEWYRDTYKKHLKRSPIPRALYSTRDSSGSEQVTWANQSTLKVMGPEGDRVHGKDADLVVADEQWKRTVDQGRELLSAANPAGSRRPDFTIVVNSTVGPDPSGWLYELMQDPNVPVLHYGCPDDVDPYDPDLWPTWHPGFEDPDPVVRATLREAIQQDITILGDDWLRSYGNRWPKVSTAGRLTQETWASLQGRVGDRGDELHVAFDTAWDRSTSTVTVTWRGDDGKVRVEVVEHRPGVLWLVDYLLDVHQRYETRPKCDTATPARDVVKALDRRGVKVDELTTPDYAASCARFVTAAVAGDLIVRPDPALDAAVAVAERRNIGDRWVWDRRRAVDMSPLTSATVATWHALMPNREAVIV